MGHFGKKPIRIGWLGAGLPGAAAQLLRQVAYVLASLGHRQPFLPHAARMGAAARWWCSADLRLDHRVARRVITGAFSVTRAAIQLGYIRGSRSCTPPSAPSGQIYMPFVNWILFVAVCLLVVGFQTSSNLASAYGIAVAATMVVEGLLLGFVARLLWKWSRATVALVIGSMILVDTLFLASNATKIVSGGWFPLLVGSAIFVVMITWKRGARSCSGACRSRASR
jgi:KUP system potassium uptake protein